MNSTLNRRTLFKLLVLGSAAVPSLVVTACATTPQGMATLAIIPRAEWGAVEPSGSGERETDKVK